MKFRTKIAICMVVFLSLAFGIGGSILIAMSFDADLRQEKSAATDSYQTILNMLAVVNSVSTQTYYGDVVDALEQLEENGGGSWSALRLSVDGNVYYESSSLASYMDDSVSTESVGRYQLLIFQEEDGYYLQVSGALEAGEKILCLDSLYDITSIYESRSEQQKLYRYVFWIIILAGFGLSWLMSWFFANPPAQLAKTARKISGGDLSVRAQVKSGDEIGLLSEDFNQMTDRLQQQIGELKDAMERQEIFMGDFAHELKTPMTAIIGYADLLRSRDLPDAQRREAANYIFSEGKRLEKLSLRILELLFTKKGELAMTPTQPAKLVRDVADLIRPVLEEKGIVLELDCEDGFCLLEPSLTTSLLINLIDNAGKSMMDGGTIRVSSSMIKDGCRFLVDDEGCGIPPEEVGRITNAFYRVDKSRSRAQGGVGLGLALCLEIVRAHEGTIDFEPRRPRGTRVTVRLRGGVPE
ncbi:MAG: HAMP domain-containing histidine kinase [Clostridiales bacterium]|nr:HAMP domain-containing histidine kinase [Clostridiales bacterium]